MSTNIGRERLEGPNFRQNFIPGGRTEKNRGGRCYVRRQGVWLKAQTEEVILRTLETLWEEQRVWAMGGFFMSFGQGRLHLTVGSFLGRRR